MPHISFESETDDRLSDLARSDRPDCDRGLGGALMSADIIQFIASPTRDRELTDFPTIAFRSVVPDLATDRAEPGRSESCEPDKRKT